MSAHPESMPEGAPDFPSEWYEPFPEPHTIPSGWDLSGVAPAACLGPADAPEKAEAVST
jgi:hypothetical protein